MKNNKQNKSKMDDLYMTVGKLKKILNDYPDDAKVLYERIEDKYFTDNGWVSEKKPDNTFEDSPDTEFIKVFGRFIYPDDKNLYLTGHY
jgi:hypothetical protein